MANTGDIPETPPPTQGSPLDRFFAVFLDQSLTTSLKLDNIFRNIVEYRKVENLHRPRILEEVSRFMIYEEERLEDPSIRLFYLAKFLMEFKQCILSGKFFEFYYSDIRSYSAVNDRLFTVQNILDNSDKVRLEFENYKSELFYKTVLRLLKPYKEYPRQECDRLYDFLNTYCIFLRIYTESSYFTSSRDYYREMKRINNGFDSYSVHRANYYKFVVVIEDLLEFVGYFLSEVGFLKDYLNKSNTLDFLHKPE